MNPKAGAYLGFDYGLRRIGVAVGQTLTASASALVTVNARDGQADWAAIENLIREWQPVGLVVGLPLDLQGEEQEISRRARKFARQLEGRFHLPVFLMEEALSSHEAGKLFAGSQSQQNKGMVDRLSARLILESWLQEQTERGRIE